RALRGHAEGRSPLRSTYRLDGRRLLRLALAEPLDHVGHVGELLLQVALVALEPVEPLLAVAEAAEAAAAVMPMTVAHGHLLSLARNGRGTTTRAPGSRAARRPSPRAGSAPPE